MKKIEDLISRHKECKNWLSEIRTWQSGITFMEDLMLRLSDVLEDENRILKLRTFYNEVDGSFKSRTSWLLQKLEIHQAGLQSCCRNKDYPDLSDLRIQHDVLRRKVAQLREEYTLIRASFFDLMKPLLRKRRLKRYQKRVA